MEIKHDKKQLKCKFKYNAVINKAHHNRCKQAVQIIVPQGQIKHNFQFRSTIRKIDCIQMQCHPNILRIRGFTLDTPSNIPQKSSTIENSKLKFLGHGMLVSLENLLKLNQGEYKTQLQSLPIYLRMQMALKVFSAVRFLHTLKFEDDYMHMFMQTQQQVKYLHFYHCNIRPSLIFLNEIGDTYLCPPLVFFENQIPKDDIRQCGEILQILINGSKYSSQPAQLFNIHLNQLLKYHYIEGTNSNIEVLNRVIDDLMVLDQSMRQYFWINKKIGNFVAESKNCTLKIDDSYDKNVKLLDHVYSDIYMKLKRSQVID